MCKCTRRRQHNKPLILSLACFAVWWMGKILLSWNGHYQRWENWDRLLRCIHFILSFSKCNCWLFFLLSLHFFGEASMVAKKICWWYTKIYVKMPLDEGINKLCLIICCCCVPFPSFSCYLYICINGILGTSTLLFGWRYQDLLGSNCIWYEIAHNIAMFYLHLRPNCHFPWRSAENG